jgi:response regulator RpfG family c-di-GMP phosphodiesterase
VEENFNKINTKDYNPIRLVFTDLNMPYLNGYEMTIKIKDFIGNNQLNDVIIILYSAMNDYSNNQNSILHINKIDDFLLKPSPASKI